ncbi:hypothetical protein [Photobacterium chitinilyticum]|uniref:hypothetical protein n=1 Tax=Photobacterium chitinilyticum TaxID=2485123 RepID=UPI0013E8EE84|nr:hypothetical protein [Photobacterium chitinilyticum]
MFSYFAGCAGAYDAMLVSCYGYGLTLANFGELLKANQVIMCPTDKTPGEI